MRRSTYHHSFIVSGGQNVSKPLAPWYGSKRTLAPRIVAALGKHSCYWEPFCGGCSVLFAKGRASYESVNDLHADLINLALVVQDESLGRALYARVDRCLFHEDMLPMAKKYLTENEIEPDRVDTNRAFWYLIFSWMGMNGISGTPLKSTGTFCCRYSAKGGNGAKRWRSVGESIPDWHERLQGVQILRRDAFLILESLDDAAGTAIYVDPPYITKGAKYVHDFKPADHERLAAALRRFKSARVVVSYYDHPLLDGLYSEWAKIDCALTKSMVNSGMRDKSMKGKNLSAGSLAPEVLLVNSRELERRLF